MTEIDELICRRTDEVAFAPPVREREGLLRAMGMPTCALGGAPPGVHAVLPSSLETDEAAVPSALKPVNADAALLVQRLA